ncbi:SHOCT domain-containing protein [Heyndrickxia coagulans]|uniref:SHOCT domain-containing protein n=1 Tax=Heyndrickxia coagulans TaxID=1398 RepID=UPI0018A77294|nr:SHOCT domain-containing protein [Heyndrickxia coagulans]MBF8417460.1 SHOCT domain-containing protein [Heyndrickxia coagulans]
MHMWYNEYGGYGMMGVFGMIAMIVQLLIFILIIYLIVIGIKKVSEKDFGVHPKEDRSLEILRERYAKGEITEEEFKKMKKDLAE